MLNTKTNQWWSGEGIWVEALGPSVCPTIPSGSVRCLEELLTRRPVLLSLPSTIVDMVRVGEAGGRRRGLGTSPSLCTLCVCVCDRPLVRVEGDFQAAGVHFWSVWRPDDLGGSMSFRLQSQREAGEIPPNPQWLWPRSRRKAPPFLKRAIHPLQGAQGPPLPFWGQWQELRDGPGILGKTSLSLPQAPHVAILKPSGFISWSLPPCVFTSTPQEDSGPAGYEGSHGLWSPGSSEPGSRPCTQRSAHCAPLPLHNPACPSAACCTQTRGSRGDCGFPALSPGPLSLSCPLCSSACRWSWGLLAPRGHCLSARLPPPAFESDVVRFASLSFALISQRF